MNDRKSAVCSPKLEAEANELKSDLERETCSTNPETDPRAPVKPLKNDNFSAILEDNPIEPLKFTVLPLKNEMTKLSESLKVLRNEACSVAVEIDPTVAVRVTVRPLKKDSVRLSEPARDLENEVCSTRLDD